MEREVVVATDVEWMAVAGTKQGGMGPNPNMVQRERKGGGWRKGGGRVEGKSRCDHGYAETQGIERWP